MLTAYLAENKDIKATCNVKVRNPKIESVEPVAPLVNLPNGIPIAQMPFPKEVVLNTEIGQVRAGVTWNLENTAYDINNKKEQTFEVEGKITLPDTIEYPANEELLNVSIQVSVLADKEDPSTNLGEDQSQIDRNKDGKAAKTGDNASIGVWITMLSAAVVMILLYIFYKKRRR